MLTRVCGKQQVTLTAARGAETEPRMSGAFNEFLEGIPLGAPRPSTGYY